MKTEASEIIFISLKQHFQNEPDSRIMKLTLKLQNEESIECGLKRQEHDPYPGPRSGKALDMGGH